MKAKRLIFVIMLVIVTLFSGVSSILRYADLRSALENCIEQKLETAAVMARAALPEDYHDRIVDSSSVSKEEFEKIVRGYNRLCVELGLEYLWSVMKIDGKVVFTSATSPDKDATNRKHAGFFEVHTNPGAYEAAFSTMTPQYQTIEDKWGALKSVLIPFTDARKRPCIFAACMTTRAIDLRLKRCVIESIFLGLGFLLFGAALSYALLNLLSRPIKRVIGKAGGIGPGRYGHTIILSFIVPFILLIAVITGSGGLIFSIEEVRSDAIRAMGDWNRLDASTRVRFSFHEKQKNRENWLTDIAILEETLGRLRESRATWILGEEAKACIDRTHDVWLATRKKLMEGDELFERARETDMGKRLGGMSYSMLVRSAFTGRLAGSHGERQLWMLYRLQDNITNLKVSGYVLGRSLRETSNDIVGRSRLLWRLIGGVTLAASAVIVFLAFSSSAYFNRATRDRESLLRTLMETISDFIWLKDPKGVYLFCNPKFERFFGAKEADIVGKTDYDFLESDLADFFREKDRAVMAAGEHRVNEEEIVYAVDGRRELIETIKTPMYDSEGGLIGVLGVARDITDRKRAEAQLNQARTYISNIIDSMPSVLVGVDAEGRVTQWNSKAEKAMGLSAVQAVGQPLVQVAPRLSREMARVREAVQSRRPQAVSKRPRPRGGETRYEDVTVYPLIANGVEGAVIRVDDVTDKVRMEEMMIQSEKMLSVGGLAAGMAHEINNPLAGMMQTAKVIGDRLTNMEMAVNRRAAREADVSLEGVKRFMENRGIPRMIAAIDDSGRRVAEIVDNMLSFARKNEDRTSSHSFEKLVNKTLELAATDYDLKKHYDFKRIEVQREYEENLPLAPCESAKIQQVLLNILRNGAEAMQEAGVEDPRFIVRTRFEKDRNLVRVEIEDNGPGMDEATRKRVFEPFFTTKPVGVGTGLGLSVSYFIISENHKGEMAVESRPGSGARFIIRLPVEPR